MNNKGQEFEWNELKAIWTHSAHTKKINIQMQSLFDELKSHVNQFEKDSIRSDVTLLKKNWIRYNQKISQFEKESIKKDLLNITKLVKRFLNLFKRKNID